MSVEQDDMSLRGEVHESPKLSRIIYERTFAMLFSYNDMRSNADVSGFGTNLSKQLYMLSDEFILEYVSRLSGVLPIHRHTQG